jgi:hypothetical protein
MNRILFIGTRGSDAGGRYIGPDGKIHVIPGWNPEQLKEVAHALQGLSELTQLKAPGVAERAAASVMEGLRKELDAHMQAGDVLVLV